MSRQSTIEKEAIILKEFHRLLRSKKEYITPFMYAEAGKKCIPFLAEQTAGAIVRKHYRELLKSNSEMTEFTIKNGNLKFPILMKDFAKKFNVCEREARLIIGYIR